MSREAPTRYYVYQPGDPAEEAPYIYGVGGPGLMPPRTMRGLTKRQAQAVASALNQERETGTGNPPSLYTDEELRDAWRRGKQASRDAVFALREHSWSCDCEACCALLQSLADIDALRLGD